jgi:hypothetical protein
MGSPGGQEASLARIPLTGATEYVGGRMLEVGEARGYVFASKRSV